MAEANEVIDKTLQAFFAAALDRGDAEGSEVEAGDLALLFTIAWDSLDDAGKQRFWQSPMLQELLTLDEYSKIFANPE